MLRKINDKIAALEAIIGTIMICMMFLILLYGIVMRYLFNQPIKWIEEITNLMLIWIGFLSICYATEKSSHVSIDFLITKQSPKVQCIWKSILQILIGITGLSLLPPSMEAIQYQITTPTLHLSLKALFTIMPIFCVLTIFHVIGNAVCLLQGRNEGERA